MKVDVRTEGIIETVRMNGIGMSNTFLEVFLKGVLRERLRGKVPNEARFAKRLST